MLDVKKNETKEMQQFYETSVKNAADNKVTFGQIEMYKYLRILITNI